MRVKVYFQMSINLYNAEIEEENHLITLGHHTVLPNLAFHQLALQGI